MKSISTKSGDAGETDLLYGGRVSKDHSQVNLCGKGDEVISFLGLVRAHCQDEWVEGHIREFQRQLFLLNAEVVTKSDKLPLLRKQFKTISAEDVASLDKLVAKLEQTLEMPKEFVLPGGSVVSAYIDVARATLRTMERMLVAFKHINPHLIPFINRLSDVLFLLARYVDRDVKQAYLRDTRL